MLSLIGAVQKNYTNFFFDFLFMTIRTFLTEKLNTLTHLFSFHSWKKAFHFLTGLLPFTIEWRAYFFTAIVSSFSTFICLEMRHYYQKKQRLNRIKFGASLEQLSRSFHSNPYNSTTADTLFQEPLYDDTIRQEQLTRNISFFGQERMDQLRSKLVVVVGLGGVGSHAAHMLVRSGVSKIRIIDFDQISLSSLNRHATALQSDVGMSKVSALQKSLKQICPWVEIDGRNELFSSEKADTLLADDPDYVLDCIDNLDTKVALLYFCLTHQLKVISASGAGTKSDAACLDIADISMTQVDPLARAVRSRLKKLGIQQGFPVVFSKEKDSVVRLLPLDASQLEEADQFAPAENFRSRILPVLGTLPAIFGLMMATHVLLELTGWPTSPLPTHQTASQIQKTFVNFRIRTAKERKLSTGLVIPFTAQDLAFIWEEIWHGKSCLSGCSAQVIPILWDPHRPIDIDNIVLMSRQEALFHRSIDSLNHYSQSIRQCIDLKLGQIQAIFRPT